MKMSGRKLKKKDDLDQWLEKEYRQDPHMEQRVATLMNEMELEMGLAKLRQQRGVSQGELARRIGVSQPAVAKIESGRVKNLELKTIVKYIAALGGRLRIEVAPAHGTGRPLKLVK